MPLTANQILALAPDAASARAGQKLATLKGWTNLGHDDGAAWGECQGSGAAPYQVQIDLNGPAYKCTCPSMKFPCKHSLALFLLLESQPPAFTGRERPPWVAAWIASRAERLEKKTEVAAKPPDPNAQSRRAEERLRKVRAGMEELELWLRDLVRQGFASLPVQSYPFWEAPAARMVDAQAPGLARQLRSMASLAAGGGEWRPQLIARVGRLYLLLEGFKRLDSLPPAVQADIRNQIGFTQAQESVLAGPGIRRDWCVIGQRIEEEGPLQTQYTWLWSHEDRQPALLLQFAVRGKGFEQSLMPGACVDAELVFYPGAYPLRALIKNQYQTKGFPERPVQSDINDTSSGWSLSLAPNPQLWGRQSPFPLHGYATITGAMESYGAALAANPWIDLFPVVLENITPALDNNTRRLIDREGNMLELPISFGPWFQLLAVSGGHPIALFGEWNGSGLFPLSCLWEGGFLSF